MLWADESPVRLTIEDLRKYTDNFSEENFIGDFQFGKVYHGKIPLLGSEHPKPVTVKKWEIPEMYYYSDSDNTDRLLDEIVFLQSKKYFHPGLMKLYGYCCETEQCGIVYDFESYNTLTNLVGSDKFEWKQRIEVALRLAQLLRFLHAQDGWLMFRNIVPSHIMVDKDWNPKLYDFGMVTGGIFPDRTLYKTQPIHGVWGYVDPEEWSQKSDVYSFGIVLLCLITKEFYTNDGREEPNMTEKAFDKYGNDYDREGGSSKTSLVSQSFEADPSYLTSDGPKVTRLAMQCIQYLSCERPKMKAVVNYLQKLLHLRDPVKV